MEKTAGVIVGIDENKVGAEKQKEYRVMIIKLNEKAKNQYDWNFSCVVMNETQLISVMYGGRVFLNACLDKDSKGKYVVKGKSGSLERFSVSERGVRPIVILSQIQNEDGKVIGYKIANYDGNVRNIVLKEMTAYGNRVTKNGGTPVQNAIFVPAEDDRAGYFKSYPNCNFLVEVLNTNVNKHTEVKRVNTQENKKNLSRLEEIYTPDQIKQLKDGRKNGVDIKIVILKNGLIEKLNVRLIAFPEFSTNAMLHYIDDLECGLDIKKYLNPKYSIEQLSELSLAVEEGLDISKMSNPKLSANDMSEIRERLERNIWKDVFMTEDGRWRYN